MNVVYFDLETQRTANDAGGWNKKHDMGMSVGVTYSTGTGEYRVYSENRVNELVEQLMKADLVVGFNVVNFDYEVLQRYTILNLKEHVPTLDLMADLETKLGHRLSLEAIAQATLGLGKTSDGLEAIRWWREGKVYEVAEYCCYDVKVTKLVHEYGAQHKKLHFTDRFQQKRTVAVEWT